MMTWNTSVIPDEQRMSEGEESLSQHRVVILMRLIALLTVSRLNAVIQATPSSQRE